jgi:hypothetical protein
MASRRSSKSAASTGKRPQKTTGCAGLEAGERVGRALALVGDGVAHAGVADLLDLGGEHADLARAELLDVDHLGAQDGEAVDGVDGVGLHHADAVAAADTPSMTRTMTTTPR